VVKYIGLIDLLYDEDVYDVVGKQKRRKTYSSHEIKKLNDLEKDMINRIFIELNNEKRMKIDFDDFSRDIDDKLENIEDTTEGFYDILSNREFLPNSPTLMNAGTGIGQLSACFVLPIEDSLASIFDSVKHAALIHKSGGGTGFSFSRLRPNRDMVASTQGVASGPLSFMRIFDVSTDVIKQGGKRRGANMGVLKVDHPDIIDFIMSKDSENKVLSNFNISVGLTDEFMKALKEDEEYAIKNPRDGLEIKRLKARMVWDLITAQAWKTGDPGIIFIDEINRYNPTPELGEIESTNPCGEQPLLPYESCNLGSINLSKFVEGGEVKWGRLKEVVRKAVHFLDNVIDANNFPLVEIKRNTRNTRKIGLGVMGWAEMLIKLGIPYDSEEAIELAEEVMGHINIASHEKSNELANERGLFPAWENSIWQDKGIKMRNATTTTIAPTGTISIIAGTSSSIEPLFAIAFIRNVMDGTELLEINPLFEEIAKQHGFYSEELMRDVAKTGSVQNLNIPEDVKRLFVTAHDITPEWHIAMQAAFQKHTDNAVSKTINMKETATTEEIEKAYMLSHELKCKGITIYRDNSKIVQVIRPVKDFKTILEEKEKVKEPIQLKIIKDYKKVESTYDPACPEYKCE